MAANASSNASPLDPRGGPVDTQARSALSNGPVLLYDGECGVCSRSVQWILAHEQVTSLRFAALQSTMGRHLRSLAQVPEDVDSLLWIESSEHGVTAKKWSTSVIAALEYVGGPWRALTIIRFIPPPIRDFGYRLFASHRKQFAPTACLLPSAEERARFLDT
jgi:predicted DCC family thiol-disulfide oxidoreductase YuxK